MALSGLQIQKLLPKTNSQECGSNTCLAFAMKLAAKKASLDECPYASEEAKQVLGAESEPPVKTITLGDKAMGGETVLYRHEKTFVNKTLITVNVNDNDTDLQNTLEKIRDYQLVRVGELLTVDGVAVTQQGDAAAFVAAAQKAAEVTGLPLILRTADASAMEQAAVALKGNSAILTGVTADNVAAMKALAEANGHVLALTSTDVDGLVSLALKLKEEEYANFVLQFPSQSLSQAFQINAIARRAALKDGLKALGHPTVAFVDTGDMLTDTVAAVNEINKYGGMVALPGFDAAQLVSLMTLRQNIYTDPQKPIQVEPKVYPIGEPDENSPVFVTTNFSLTYFIVSGEIENAGISAWLVIPECEGFSVLTAWAAGKFSGAMIGKAIKESGLEDMVKTRSVTIPGYVSQISGELEESLPGWKVLVGPQEAGDLESYIKSVLAS